MSVAASHFDPLKRFKLFGPDSLTGQDLLAIILGSGNKNSLEKAGRVLTNYGKKAVIYEKNVSNMQKLTGLSAEECARVIAAFDLGRRYVCPHGGRPKYIHQAADVYRLLRGRMEDKEQECLYGIYIDSGSRILREHVISVGTINQTFMQPRDIFRPAMECNAAGVIIVHNHPSGNPTPSTDDLQNTAKAQQAGEMLGYPLLDHIVIGYGKYVSILQEKESWARPKSSTQV